METHTGIYGAKVQSWREHSPRALLKRLVDANPRADKEDLRDLFIRALGRSSGAKYIEAVADYWFNGNYQSLLAPATRPPSAAEKREQRQRIDTIKETIAARIMLDWVLLNGKKLRDCTRQECGVQSRRLGPWLNKIASRVPRGKTVGDVLSEAQVRALYKRGARA